MRLAGRLRLLQQALRRASWLQWLYHRLMAMAEGPRALWVMPLSPLAARCCSSPA
jgi:hypothetical protein